MKLRLSHLYYFVGLAIVVVALFFPNLIVTSKEPNVNLLLALLMAGHFFNSAKLDELRRDNEE